MKTSILAAALFMICSSAHSESLSEFLSKSASNGETAAATSSVTFDGKTMITTESALVKTKVDQVNIEAYLRSEDVVTGYLNSKDKSQIKAVKSLDSKIDAFNTKMNRSFLNRLKISTAKSGDATMMYGSEIQLLMNARPYESGGSIYLTQSAGSSAPSLAYHFIAVQKITVSAENKFPQEIAKAISWSGADFTLPSMEFNNSFSDSMRFPGRMFIFKSKNERAGQQGYSGATTEYIYTEVDESGNAIRQDIVETTIEDNSGPNGTVSRTIIRRGSSNTPKPVQVPEAKIQYGLSPELKVKLEKETLATAISKALETSEKEAAKKKKTVKGKDPKLEKTVEFSEPDKNGLMTVTAKATLTYTF